MSAIIGLMGDVTHILSQIEAGDPSAADQLLPHVYAELRNLAKAKMVHEKPGNTLQATAIVHEAYLRLVGGTGSRHWDSRGHFFAAAAEAMRRILVENARRKQRVKHGGEHARDHVDVVEVAVQANTSELLSVHEALDDLADTDIQAAELVKLRYFVGMTIDESAEVLGISSRTAHRNWSFARAWLKRRLSE